MLARLLIVCLFGLSMPGLAYAADWPAPIQSLTEQGITIVKKIDAPEGMTGYAAKAGQTPVALYLTSDGKHVIVGTLLDETGKNLSRAPLLAIADAKPGLPKDTWQQLKQSAWIADGPDDAPRTVYVITDPNCPYCHRFYESSRPWVKAGKVQLRHIPVGVIRPSSPAKSAALLAADDPSAAYRAHENNYESGGIKPMADVPTDLQEKISTNGDLMKRLGIRGTPGIVYKNADDKITIFQGAARNSKLLEVLGPKPK